MDANAFPYSRENAVAPKLYLCLLRERSFPVNQECLFVVQPDDQIRRASELITHGGVHLFDFKDLSANYRVELPASFYLSSYAFVRFLERNTLTDKCGVSVDCCAAPHVPFRCLVWLPQDLAHNGSHRRNGSVFEPVGVALFVKADGGFFHFRGSFHFWVLWVPARRLTISAWRFFILPMLLTSWKWVVFAIRLLAFKIPTICSCDSCILPKTKAMKSRVFASPSFAANDPCK